MFSQIVDDARCEALFEMLAGPCAGGFEHLKIDPGFVGKENDPFSRVVKARQHLHAFLSTDGTIDELEVVAADMPEGVSIRTLIDAQAELLRRGGEHERATALEQQHRQLVGAFRRDIYHQARMKLEWLKELPVEHVAAFMTVALDASDPPILRSRTLRLMKDFVREHGTGYAELPMPTSFSVPSPKTFRSNETSVTKAIGRTAFVGALSNAVVRHRSSMIRVGDSFLLDAEDDEMRDIDLVLHVDPSVMDAEGTTVLGFEYGTELRLAEAVHLGGVPSRVFGHWICQFLPKFFGARFSGQLPAVPILVDAHMPASHIEALSYFLDDDGTAIVEIPELTSVQVDRLWVLSDWSYVPIAPAPGQDLGPKHLSPPPEQMAAIVRAMLARKPAPTKNKMKLFIARHTFRHRRMVNHDQIMQCARDLGYQAVYLEEHPFAEQIELVRSAGTIIGPDGSSHILCMFAQPGTKITMLSHGFVENNAGLFAIFAALDLDAMMLQGSCVQKNEAYPRFSDYEIDEAEFLEVATR